MDIKFLGISVLFRDPRRSSTIQHTYSLLVTLLRQEATTGKKWQTQCCPCPFVLNCASVIAWVGRLYHGINRFESCISHDIAEIVKCSAKLWVKLAFIIRSWDLTIYDIASVEKHYNQLISFMKKPVKRRNQWRKNNLKGKTDFLLPYTNLIKIQNWKGYTHLVAI